MRPYVVRQGDYLDRIAFFAGVSAQAIWDEPRNEPVKRAGRTPTLLLPGDVLFLPAAEAPGVSLAVGASNSYVANAPMVQVVLVLAQGDAVLADEPYVVEGLGALREGRTESDGKVTVDVPVDTQEFSLLLVDRSLRYPVHVGHMDPVAHDTGVAARLANLGYLWELPLELAEILGGVLGDSATRLAGAVEAFQLARGLDPAAGLDAATRAALVEAHGS